MESFWCWSLLTCGALVVLFLEGCGGGDTTATAAQTVTTTSSGGATTKGPTEPCLNEMIDLHTQSNDGKVTGTYHIHGVATPMPLPPVDATITEKVDFEKMNYFVDLNQELDFMGQKIPAELQIVFNAEAKRVTLFYNVSGMLQGCNYTIQKDMPAPDVMANAAKSAVQKQFNCSGSDGTYDTFVMDAGSEGNKTHIEVQMDKDYLIHSTAFKADVGMGNVTVKFDLNVDMEKSTTDGPSAADLDVSRFGDCHPIDPSSLDLFDFFQPGLGSSIHPQLRIPDKTFFQKIIVMAMRNSSSEGEIVV